MLTQNDFDKIENIVDEKFNERLNLLPSKDEFFTIMDQIVGELKRIRESITLINHRVSDHTDRIEKLEQIHQIN